jgi:hypothetical protein
MMNRHLVFGALSLLLWSLPALAFDEPVFPLNADQLEALELYGTARGVKAFAAGPEGQFSAQSGFVSAAVAAREALKACDKGISQRTKRCILIDLNGDPVPLALQHAQMMRIDDEISEGPVSLRDLTFGIDTWRAYQGFAEKGEHKAFALSLKGVWARSWDAASLEEAEKEALEACNRNEAAATAPCFIIARDGVLAPAAELQAKSDLSVSSPKSQ